MYLNFIIEFEAVLALPKMARSAQTHKSIPKFHLNCLEHSICISLALGTISFTDSLKAPMFWVIMQGPVSCKLWRVSGNKNPYDYQFWPWKTWQKIKRLTQEEGVCVSQKKKYQAQTAVVNKTFWKVKKNAPMRIYLQNFTENTR